MKYCPKCRSFYDDASLAFCLADGIPLVEINESDSLWNEGSNAIETSRKIVIKQVRRQKFAKISRILVMMMLIAMAITVVAMNIYVNIPTKKDEIVANISPTPTIMPTVAPTSRTNTEQTPLPTISPTQTPSPTETLTETVTPTKTPVITPKPTTPFPPGDPCIHQQVIERPNLLKSNASFFRSIIERDKGEVIGEYQRMRRKPATAEAILQIDNTTVTFKNCNSAAEIIVPYFWRISPQSPAAVKEPSVDLPTKQKRFSCQKGRIWVCEPL